MDVLIYQPSVGRGYVGGADEASSALAYRFRVWSGQSAFTVTASNLDPSPVSTGTCTPPVILCPLSLSCLLVE
jgi:hypothetical protein